MQTCLHCHKFTQFFFDHQPDYEYDEIKCMGKFKCKKCDNRWTSSNTWIFYYQKCFKCNRKNFYEKCYDFMNGYYGSTSDKHHNPESCEKCQELGTNCKESEGNDFKYYFK